MKGIGSCSISKVNQVQIWYLPDFEVTKCMVVTAWTCAWTVVSMSMWAILTWSSKLTINFSFCQQKGGSDQSGVVKRS